MMKIVVCGKGGSGKSTILTLLARQYVKEEKNILVIDTDESNSGLHRLLDMDAPSDLIDLLGGKKYVTEKIMGSLPDLSDVTFFRQPIQVDTLPPGYVSRKDSLRLISIGKIHSFGEGCACPMGFVAKQFLSGLDIRKDEIVLIDTEAGIEHFGRGIEEGADLVLVILDPSYESVLLAGKITGMTGIRPDVFYLLNKTDYNTSSRLRRLIAHPERILGELPLIPAITSAGLEGETMDGFPPEMLTIKNRIEDITVAS